MEILPLQELSSIGVVCSTDDLDDLLDLDVILDLEDLLDLDDLLDLILLLDLAVGTVTPCTGASIAPGSDTFDDLLVFESLEFLLLLLRERDIVCNTFWTAASSSAGASTSSSISSAFSLAVADLELTTLS